MYTLTDSASSIPGMLHVGAHPALAARPVPAVLDSSWLASGEDFRVTNPGTYERVQELWNRGEPPTVHVISDHGTWGTDAEALGEGLVAEVEGIDALEGLAFRGRPGFRYSGNTLDRVVLARRGVLPDWTRILVFQVQRPDGLGSVEEMLGSPPVNQFARLRTQLGPDVTASFRTASEDHPAFLLAVAGPRLGPHMIPTGFVLGLWEIRGRFGDARERGDYYAVETPKLAALRASLVGTVVDAPAVTHKRWA
ncbi:hypothetical protein [Sanguibacter sp. Z1732]|uniref:hypothetical protein n=1 Tax=Sanguibacter sp. Z1732 TaxID=3435412 RepID=UPI003D9C8B09